MSNANGNQDYLSDNDRPKKKPLKIIIERLIRIEKLAKENKEISAAIFVVVLIVGFVGFIADVSSLFGEKKYTVHDLEKKDFVPEFFMYEKIIDEEEVLIDLNPSEKLHDIVSAKFAASCDGENYTVLGWYPVEVKGDCIYSSDTFYLKVISREGEESESFHYKLNFPEEIRKYKSES